MSDIALRPRSATEIVDASFQVYRREPLQFILGLGLIYVPWLVLLAVLNLDPSGMSQASVWQAIVVGIGGIVVYTFASGVTIGIANDVYFGRPADIGAAFRNVASRGGTLIVAMILVGFLAGFGFALLIIPGLYVLARLFAVRQAILLEGAGIGESFSRSSRLSDGQKLHILGTIILVFLLLIAVAFGTSMVTQMIPSRIARLVLSTCTSVLIYPMMGIAETLLYYDTRIRNEGFDVEYLASSMPLPEQAAP
jgi:hypothetical protein